MKRLALSLVSLAAALSLTACVEDESDGAVDELPGFPASSQTDMPGGVVESFEIGPPSVLHGFGTDGRIEIRFPDDNGECCIVVRYAPSELMTAGRK